MNVETVVCRIIYIKKGELLYNSSNLTLFHINSSNYDMKFTFIDPMYTPPSPSQTQCCFLILNFEKNYVPRSKVLLSQFFMLNSNLESEFENLRYIFLNTIFNF